MAPICLAHATESKLQVETKGRWMSHCSLEHSPSGFVNANFARWDLEKGWPNSKSTVDPIRLWWCFVVVFFLNIFSNFVCRCILYFLYSFPVSLHCYLCSYFARGRDFFPGKLISLISFLISPSKFNLFRNQKEWRRKKQCMSLFPHLPAQNAEELFSRHGGTVADGACWEPTT